MIELVLTTKNSPQMSIVPPTARYNEKEVMILPNFQYVSLMQRKDQLPMKNAPNKLYPHKIFTLAEIPYQNNISKIEGVEDYLVIWFDIYAQEQELEMFKIKFPNRFRLVRTEEQLFELLRRCTKCHLILQGSLAFYLIPYLGRVACLAYKIRGIFMWTSQQGIKEKKQLLNEMRGGYQYIVREVFYNSLKDIITTIHNNEVLEAQGKVVA